MTNLHLDANHPLLLQGLEALGYINHEMYTAQKAEVLDAISAYDGVVIRSRLPIDREFLDAATNLKFIARVGAGMENIDVEYAESKGVVLINAPEGNRQAVAEHALGMLLAMMNKFRKSEKEIESGQWLREPNRGTELSGKTVGIIGYGNTGKAFARVLSGFDLRVVCCDILDNLGDAYAEQVALDVLQAEADVISLHVPQTPLTTGMMDRAFIDAVSKPFWLLNTARGKNVVTADLVEALESGKVLGAGLDVLEYERSSFENIFDARDLPEPLAYLIRSEKVILTPHVAGWTVESKIKLAETILQKIQQRFC